MKHSLQAVGYNIRLRPVQIADAEFIIQLRNLPNVIGTVGDTVPDVSAQQRWIESSWQRPGDYYLIIESLSGKRIGTIAIYDVSGNSGEWGRWITIPGMMVGLSSAILIHDLAFGSLGLQGLRGCVVSDNLRVISFHRKFGLEQTGIELNARQIGGKPVDLIWFSMKKERWPETRSRLHPLAEAGAIAMSESL
jgi:RimJ/RimL family protein N-acetyltransferase